MADNLYDDLGYAEPGEALTHYDPAQAAFPETAKLPAGAPAGGVTTAYKGLDETTGTQPGADWKQHLIDGMSVSNARDAAKAKTNAERELPRIETPQEASFYGSMEHGLGVTNLSAFADTFDHIGDMTGDKKWHGYADGVRKSLAEDKSAYKPIYESYKQVGGVSDLWGYAKETAGEQVGVMLPMIASSLALGYAGSVTGEMVGGKAGAKFGGVTGAMTGAAIGSVHLQVSEMRNALKGEGVEGEQLTSATNMGAAVLVGLDMAFPAYAAVKIGGFAHKAIAGKVAQKLAQDMAQGGVAKTASEYVKLFGKELTKEVALEVTTELAQQAVEDFGSQAAAGRTITTGDLTKFTTETAPEVVARTIIGAGFMSTPGAHSHARHTISEAKESLKATPNPAEAQGQSPNSEAKGDMEMPEVPPSPVDGTPAVEAGKIEAEGTDLSRELPPLPDAKDKGVAVLQFIRGKGGLVPSGELAGLDAHRHPGLVNQGGLTADQMREQLVEAGYLEESGPDQPAVTTPADVFDLVQRAISGERIVPVDQRGADEDYHAAVEARDAHKELLHGETMFVTPALEQYDEELGDNVMTKAYRKLSQTDKLTAIDRVRRGADIGDVLEEIAMRDVDVETLQAMIMKRGPDPAIVDRIRQVIAQHQPQLLEGFDEMLGKVPVRQPRASGIASLKLEPGEHPGTRSAQELMRLSKADLTSLAQRVGAGARSSHNKTQLVQNIIDHGTRLKPDTVSTPAKGELPELSAVPVRRSVNPAHIVSLIDGSKHIDLRPHLAEHGVTTEQYARQYNLNPDYPLVAPNEVARQYAANRPDMGHDDFERQFTVEAATQELGQAPAGADLEGQTQAGETAQAPLSPELEALRDRLLDHMGDADFELTNADVEGIAKHMGPGTSLDRAISNYARDQYEAEARIAKEGGRPGEAAAARAVDARAASERGNAAGKLVQVSDRAGGDSVSAQSGQTAHLAGQEGNQAASGNGRVAALESAIQDRDRFGALVDDYATRMTKADLEDVAAAFLGYRNRYGSKAAIVAQLKSRQSDTAIGGMQIETIEKLFQNTPQRDLGAELAAVLRTKTPLAQWAPTLGVTAAELRPHVEAAIEAGLLRRDTQGRVRRAALAQQARGLSMAAATHAESLFAAGLDDKRFDAALAALAGDKALSKQELSAIADDYRNRPSGGTHAFKYTTKREVLGRIRDVFIERVEGESKRRIIEKLSQWPAKGFVFPGKIGSEQEVTFTDAAASKVEQLQAAVDKAVAGILPSAVRVTVQQNIELAQAEREDELYSLREASTKGAESDTLDQGSDGGVREQLSDTGTTPGREGGTAGEGQSAPRGTAGERAGGKAAGDRGAGGLESPAVKRIIRQESASLDANGDIVVGRRPRDADGERKASGAAQRVGKAESFRIDGYEGRVTADELEAGDKAEGNLARLTYEVFDPIRASKTSDAKMEVVQHSDGAWEIDFVSSAQKRKGVGSKLYAAVEKDLGIRMSPSGILSNEGLAFWQKRSPASVQWHVPTPTWAGFNFSPAKIARELDRVGREMANIANGVGKAATMTDKLKADLLTGYRKERGQLIKLWAGVPPEARVAVKANEMFSLVGAKAQTADLTALGRAQDLERAGQTPEEIHKATGWYKDSVDGEWRFEIDDSQMKLKFADEEDTEAKGLRFRKAKEASYWSRPDTYSFNGTLGELIDHPALFAAYPQLANMKVHIGRPIGFVSAGSLSDSGISISGERSLNDIQDTLVHEYQHAIQEIEGFSPGGNQGSYMARIDSALFEVQQQIKAARPGSNIVGALKEIRDALKAQQEFISKGISGFAVTGSEIDAYERLKGEVEARNAADRRDMSPEERQASFPPSTEDVPADQQYDRRQLVALRPQNEKLIDRLVKQGTKGWPNMVDRVDEYGDKTVTLYRSISLDPAFSGDNNPKGIAGKRGNVSESMDFTAAAIGKKIKLYGAQALRNAIADHISYEETGPALRNKETGELVPADPNWKPRAARMEDLQLTAELLDNIIAKHPELAAKPGYDRTEIDPAKLIDAYQGRTFTRDDVEALVEQLQERIQTLGEDGTLSADDAEAYAADLASQWSSQLDTIREYSKAHYDAIYKAAPELVDGLRLAEAYLRYQNAQSSVFGRITQESLDRGQSGPAAEALGKTDPHANLISIGARAAESEARRTGKSTSRIAAEAARHEALEFFKAHGIIQPQEWETLRSTALAENWIGETGVRDAYEAQYQGKMSPADLNELVLKESIMEKYGRYRSGDYVPTGLIAKVFKRISDLFERLISGIKGNGFQRWEDIFQKMDAGEFKRRYEMIYGTGSESEHVGAQAIIHAGTMQDAPGLTPAVGAQVAQQTASPSGSRIGAATAAVGRAVTNQAPNQLPGILDTIQALQTALGLSVRTGRLDPALRQAAGRARRTNPGAQLLGQYNGVARTAIATDVDAISHEAGHHVERLLGAPLRALMQQHAAELAPLAGGTLHGATMPEGFAEFFRRFITNPVAAQQRAPGFLHDFTQMLDAHDPLMLQRLEHLQEGYQQYLMGDPVEQGIANQTVLRHTAGVFGRYLADAERDGHLNTVGDRLHSLYQATISQNHGWWMATRDLLTAIEVRTGQRISLATVDNAKKLLQMTTHTGAWAQQDLKEGIALRSRPNGGGVSMHRVLATAFGSLDRGAWNERGAQEFGEYLIARRAIGQYIRFQPAMRAQVQAFIAANPRLGFLLRRLPNVTQSELDRPPTKESLNHQLMKLNLLEQRMPQFRQAAELYYQFNKDILTFLHEKSLLSTEEYNRLSQDTDYAPFQRDMSDQVYAEGGNPSSRRPGRGRDQINKRNVYRAFEGSMRDIINPVQSTVQFVYEMKLRAAINDTLRAMDRLARQAGQAGNEIFERLPPREAAAHRVSIREALRTAGREVGMSPQDITHMLGNVENQLGQNVVTTLFSQRPTSERGERIVWFFENGEPVPVQLADGELGRMMFEGLTAVGQRNQTLLTQILSVPAHTIRSGVTLSFEFMFRNIFVDALTSWVNSPHARPFLTQAAGIREIWSGGQYQQLYNRYAGMMGGEAHSAISDQSIERDIESLRQRGFQVRRPESIGDFARMIFQVGEFSETATRVGVFRNAMRSAIADGMSPQDAAIEAAHYAHDVYNFSQHGSMTESLRRMIPFWNAAVIGVDKYVKTMTAANDYGNAMTLWTRYRRGLPISAHEQQALGQAAKAWAISTLVFGGMSLIFAALGADDEDQDEISDNLRATHWRVSVNGIIHLLPKSFKTFMGIGEHSDVTVRLPKPFEMAWAANAVERALDAALKQDPEAGKRFMSDFWSCVMPPDSIPGLDVAYGFMSGKDFYTGNDIIPFWEKGRERADQFGPYTTETARRLGKAMNMSPYYVDYLVRGLGASLGRDVTTIGDIIARKGPLPSISEYPVARRFTYNTSRSSESLGKFYDMVHDKEGLNSWFWDATSKDARSFVAAAESYKMRVDSGKQAQADEFYDNLNPDQKAYATLAVDFKGRRDSKLRNLHPILNAQEGVTVANQLMKEVVDGTLRIPAGKKNSKGDDEFRQLDRNEMREARNEIGHIRKGMAQNALQIMGIEGWAAQKLMDTDKRMDTLKSVAPDVHAELIRRLQKKGYEDPKHLAKVWPDVKARLLANRAQADIGEFYDTPVHGE